MTPSLSALCARVLKLDAEATKGPWRWNLNPRSKTLYLESRGCGHGSECVMDFVRWGMGGATPRFRTLDDCGLMDRAQKWARDVPGREHHAPWYQALDHPDANALAECRTAAPTLARALQDAEALLAECAEMMGTMGVFMHPKPFNPRFDPEAFVELRQKVDLFLGRVEETPETK